MTFFLFDTDGPHTRFSDAGPIKVELRPPGSASANLQGKKPREVGQCGALDAMWISVLTRSVDELVGKRSMCSASSFCRLASQALKTFACQARRRMRTESGGYRRDHLRALAQRVEVDAKEVRIKGSKGALLRTLVAAPSAKTAGFGVPSSVPNWRTRHDSNVWPLPLEGTVRITAHV